MSRPVPFWKMESIGNDFPLVHLLDLDAGASLPELAVAMCDRKFGVGGDGLLVLSRGGAGGPELVLRMFNPDGTEDFCGNGLRCAAVHARGLDWVGNRFTIRHLGWDVPVTVEGCGVTTQLGPASYDPSKVPLRTGAAEIFRGRVYWDKEREVVGSALTTGSTHVIVPVADLPGDEEFLLLGPLIENFELYPKRTSIIWTEVVGENHLRVRIWERGVGETLGCGTGSSAAAADYLRTVGGGGTVTVENPGGSVVVTMDAWDAPISVTGTAREVFEGDFCRS